MTSVTNDQQLQPQINCQIHHIKGIKDLEEYDDNSKGWRTKEDTISEAFGLAIKALVKVAIYNIVPGIVSKIKGGLPIFWCSAQPRFGWVIREWP